MVNFDASRAARAMEQQTDGSGSGGGGGTGGGGNSSGDAARERRAQRNREAAHRSRAKHKQQTQKCEAAAKRALKLHEQLRALLDVLVDDIAPLNPPPPLFVFPTPSNTD